MNRERALAEIGRTAKALRERGVASAFLFGSTARDEASEESDLDLFVDIEPGRKFSLFDLAAMETFLADELGLRVDLTTRDSLHPALRRDIEERAVRVF